MSFNIYVGVMINDYHHLRGGGDGVFIKEFHIVMYVVLAMTSMAL